MNGKIGRYPQLYLQRRGGERRERTRERRRSKHTHRRARVLWGAGASYPPNPAPPDSPPFSLSPISEAIREAGGTVTVPHSSAAGSKPQRQEPELRLDAS